MCTKCKDHLIGVPAMMLGVLRARWHSKSEENSVADCQEFFSSAM